MKALGEWLLAGALCLVAGCFLLWVGWDLITNLASMSKNERGYVIGGVMTAMVLLWHVDRMSRTLDEVRNEVRHLKGLLERRS